MLEPRRQRRTFGTHPATITSPSRAAGYSRRGPVQLYVLCIRTGRSRGHLPPRAPPVSAGYPGRSRPHGHRTASGEARAARRDMRRGRNQLRALFARRHPGRGLPLRSRRSAARDRPLRSPREGRLRPLRICQGIEAGGRSMACACTGPTNGEQGHRCNPRTPCSLARMRRRCSASPTSTSRSSPIWQTGQRTSQDPGRSTTRSTARRECRAPSPLADTFDWGGDKPGRRTPWRRHRPI